MRRNRFFQENDRSTTHRRGRRTKPFFASGRRTTSKTMPSLLGSRCRGLLSRVPLVDPRQFHVPPCHFLNLSRQFGDLISLLLIGRGNDESQQIAQSINGK